MPADTPTVLVVDDDPDLLDLVCIVLEQEGYQVVRASDGAAALEEAAHRRPDLILLDLKMPVMDGTRFARLFRERHGTGTPIVVFTAADDPRKRAADIDAAGVLPKPFSYDALVATVDGLLRPERPRARP